MYSYYVISKSVLFVYLFIFSLYYYRTNANVYFSPKSFKLWVWNCRCRHCGERDRNTLGAFLCTVKKGHISNIRSALAENFSARSSLFKKCVSNKNVEENGVVSSSFLSLFSGSYW